MSQRASGYDRIDGDLYETPTWVVHALAEHVDLGFKTIWEPACGSGKMVAALKDCGALLYATDIDDLGCPHAERHDFLSESGCPGLVHFDGIVTNPPYGQRGKMAAAFIERGLRHITDYGFLALLLPVDFDAAGGRQHLFGECREFAGRITLTKRIKWFDGPSSPSVNHAWFLWQRTWIGDSREPRIWYAPNGAIA